MLVVGIALGVLWMSWALWALDEDRGTSGVRVDKKAESVSIRVGGMGVSPKKASDAEISPKRRPSRVQQTRLA